MTDEEIFFDYKEYESGGKKFGIGCVNAYDEDGARNLVERMLVERMTNVLSSVEASTDMDMLFLQIRIFHDGISVTYLVSSNEVAAKVL